MKKGLLYLGIAASLLSCNKALSPIEVAEEPQLVEGSILELDFTINDAAEPDTRGIQKDWSHGEEVYVFFDKTFTSPSQYMIAKYDKSGTVTGKAKTWYAKSWTSGLEAKISKRSSGVLAALYTHTSSIHGSTDILYKNTSCYTISPGTVKGGVFSSYWLEATDISYTVSGGKLSASFTLSAPSDRYFIQFSMPNKDRDGNTISNSDAQSTTVYKYALRCKSIESPGYNKYYGVSRCYPNTYNADGSFGYFDSGLGKPDVLSGYFYGGLCFSGLQMMWNGASAARRYEFMLYVYEQQRTLYYAYRPDFNIALVGGGAYKLPALNAKDSSGNYYWVEQ